MISLVLFFYITHGILCAPFVKFVNCNYIGKIQHINFFELYCSAKLRRHNIEADVRMIDNFGVGLTYAGGFDDDEVKLCSFEDLNRFIYMR